MVFEFLSCKGTKLAMKKKNMMQTEFASNENIKRKKIQDFSIHTNFDNVQWLYQLASYLGFL